jgi:YVTN family beta-propeller protein
MRGERERETKRRGDGETGGRSDNEARRFFARSLFSTCLLASSSSCRPIAPSLCLFVLLFTPFLFLAVKAQTKTQPPQRFEKGGVAMEMSLQPSPNSDNAIFTLRVNDASTGEPLSNLRPKAWIVPRKSATAPMTEEGCREMIRSQLSGKFNVNADIDLNSYRLLTLNHDKSITIINPLIRFGRTKLESIIPLPSAGADWVLAPNNRTLFVTMPDQSEVAVVDLVDRRLIVTIPTGGKPRRIKMTPDGRHVWVAVDEAPRAVAIDALTYRGAAVVPIGDGLHNLAMTTDGRFAAITNSASDTVSLIDLRTMKKLRDVPVGQTPVAIAYGAAARLFYTADLNGGSVSAIDPEAQRTVAVIPAKRGIVGLGFSPDSRFAVLVNQIEGTISVLDSAINSITAEARVGGEPDQVAFTARYAYVRRLASEKFALFDLAEIRQGKLDGVDIQAGRQAPKAAPVHHGIAGMIAPTPEGNAVMIANQADRTIYYYTEGMMAPMGTFDNYKRTPLALMVLDNSLTETIAGVYSVPVKISSSGDFAVPVLIDQPRITHCFPLSLRSTKPAPTASALAVEFMFGDRGYKAGDPVKLKFKVLDATTRAPLSGLRDVRAMVMEPPDGWQQRQWAVEVDPGVYEVTQLFPRPGLYQVLISVESRGAGFTKLPSIKVKVIG